MEFTTQELAPIAEQMAALCVQRMENGRERHILGLEDGVRQGLKELGGMVLGRTLSQAEAVPAREIACGCGGRLAYQRQRRAKIESIFGWVSYERSYYAECECGVGQAPFG